MRTRASPATAARHSAPSIVRWLVAACIGATVVLSAPAAQSQDDAAAKKILKTMSDYVASQKVISLMYDSDIEVVDSDLQKLQFASSGQLLLSRPDKLRASRMGGYTDVEFILDGATFTAHDRASGAYAQAAAPGTVDKVIGDLREEYLVEAPGADLLLSNAFETLTENVFHARHIGHGVIDGVDCDHLAFRTDDADWQIWVEIGQRPIPRKYVITSKTVAGAPQYTLRIKEWKTDAPIAANTFAFSPPASAKKVDFKELAEIDEVPSGTVRGASQ